jgi:hypothetical protein
MSGVNGGRPVLANTTVPIVGQAFTLKSGYATALIQCGCEAREPLLLVGQFPTQCPACRRGFVLTAFTVSQGQVQVQIGLVSTEARGVVT